jgi:hypothetical protein
MPSALALTAMPVPSCRRSVCGLANAGAAPANASHAHAAQRALR